MAGIRHRVDWRDERPGDKYAHWELKGVPIRLNVGAMVDKMQNRNARGELGEAADMIGMVVTGDQMVEPTDARAFGGRHDPIGISDCSRTAIS